MDYFLAAKLDSEAQQFLQMLAARRSALELYSTKPNASEAHIARVNEEIEQAFQFYQTVTAFREMATKECAQARKTGFIEGRISKEKEYEGHTNRRVGNREGIRHSSILDARNKWADHY